MLDPPTRPNLPVNNADKADVKLGPICMNLRDLRENHLMCR